MAATRIQTAIDEAMAGLARLRNSNIASLKTIDEYSPSQLRELAWLSNYAAEEFDPIIRAAALEAGIKGAYANQVRDLVHDDLEAALKAKADSIEDQNEGSSDFSLQREWGTLRAVNGRVA